MQAHAELVTSLYGRLLLLLDMYYWCWIRSMLGGAVMLIAMHMADLRNTGGC